MVTITMVHDMSNGDAIQVEGTLEEVAQEMSLAQNAGEFVKIAPFVKGERLPDAYINPTNIVGLSD